MMKTKTLMPGTKLRIKQVNSSRFSGKMKSLEPDTFDWDKELLSIDKRKDCETKMRKHGLTIEPTDCLKSLH